MICQLTRSFLVISGATACSSEGLDRGSLQPLAMRVAMKVVAAKSFLLISPREKAPKVMKLGYCQMQIKRKVLATIEMQLPISKDNNRVISYLDNQIASK